MRSALAVLAGLALPRFNMLDSRMDPASAITTTVKVGGLGYKGWGWWQHLRNGKVFITHPPNRSIIQSQWVTLEGGHDRAKRAGAHFWLLTTREGNKYWPQWEIALEPDGRWRSSINTGWSPGPRTCVVLLVKVTDFINEILIDVKDRSKKANDYGPLVMNPPKNLFSVVQGLVLEVPSNHPPNKG